MSRKEIAADELNAFLQSEEFGQIVQKRQDTYKKKWLKWTESQGAINLGSKRSWNWASFFFQELWMLYRKMYLHFFIMLAGRTIALLAMTTLIQGSTQTNVVGAFNIAMMFVAGFFGNAWYLSKCFTLIDQAKQKFSVNNMVQAEPQREFFKKSGGTSWKNVFIYWLVVILIIFGVSYYIGYTVEQASQGNASMQSTTNSLVSFNDYTRLHSNS